MIERATNEYERLNAIRSSVQRANTARLGQRPGSLLNCSTIVTPDEYRLLYAVPNQAPTLKPKGKGRARSVKRRWRFKPRAFWSIALWGVIVFAGFRILIFPLAEGIYNFGVKNSEIRELQTQYHQMQKEMRTMKKTWNYMKTTAYVEEKAHQIGLIKPNESKVEVVESSSDGQTFKALPRINKIYGD